MLKLGCLMLIMHPTVGTQTLLTMQGWLHIYLFCLYCEYLLMFYGDYWNLSVSKRETLYTTRSVKKKKKMCELSSINAGECVCAICPLSVPSYRATALMKWTIILCIVCSIKKISFPNSRNNSQKTSNFHLYINCHLCYHSSSFVFCTEWDKLISLVAPRSTWTS